MTDTKMPKIRVSFEPARYNAEFYEEWLTGLSTICTCDADSDAHDERCCLSVASLGLEYGAAVQRELNALTLDALANARAAFVAAVEKWLDLDDMAITVGKNWRIPAPREGYVSVWFNNEYPIETPRWAAELLWPGKVQDMEGSK